MAVGDGQGAVTPPPAGDGYRVLDSRNATIAFSSSGVRIFVYEGMFVAPWSPRFTAKPLPASVVGTTSGEIATGAALFYSKGCEYCHAVAGYGGIRGPDLTYAGDRMTADQVKTRLYSGATNMPSYTKILTPDELNAIVAFLESRTRYPSPAGGGLTAP